MHGPPRNHLKVHTMHFDNLPLLSRLQSTARLRLLLGIGLLPLAALICFGCSRLPSDSTATPKKDSAPQSVSAAVDVRLVRRGLTLDEAGAYAGNAACAECHAGIVHQHAQSRHALTLKPVTLAEHAKAFSQKQIVTDPNLGEQYTTKVANGKCLINGSTAQAYGSMSADYVIGTGKNAYTFFNIIEPNAWIDLRISYYAQAKKWDFTPMQRPENHAPGDAGILEVGERLSSCLLCHVTVLRMTAGQIDIGNSALGIGCERCHGPGKAHIETAKRKGVDKQTVRKSIDDLHLATPGAINKICGDCHRTAENSPLGDAHTEHDLARFQGAAMVRSKCYTQSGALSCLTCHDSHSNAVAQPAYYDAICIKCHTSTAAAHPASAAGVTPALHSVGRICPVNAHTGCTKCHMPRQKISDIPYATYANHWIKVWKH